MRRIVSKIHKRTAERLLACLARSPAHKRRKLLGTQVVANASQADTGDAIIKQPFPHSLKGQGQDASARRMRQIEQALRNIDSVGPHTGPQNEGDNPSGSKLASEPSYLVPPSEFSSLPVASQAPRSPSPEIPPERDYSSWFNSDTESTSDSLDSTLFKTAKSVGSTGASGSMPVFKVSSGRGLIMPSETALNAAREKMKAWQEEETNPVSTSPIPSLGPADSSLDFADGRSQFLQSPSPATFTNATALEALMSHVSKDFDSPCRNLERKSKPFRSPLLPLQANLLDTPYQVYAGSPLNPSHSASTAFVMSSKTTCDFSPVRPSTVKARGAVGGRGRVKPKFVTPFLPGRGPGETGRIALEKRKEDTNDSKAIQIPSTPETEKAEVIDFGNVGTESKDDWPAVDKGAFPFFKKLCNVI
jgi:hypothetical protein